MNGLTRQPNGIFRQRIVAKTALAFWRTGHFGGDIGVLIDYSGVDRLVGQRIRAWRQASGLTQAELGDRVGVTFQQIQKYERGHNRVSVSRLFGIAHALGVSPLTFMDGVDVAIPGEPGVTDRLTWSSDPEVVCLVEACGRLPRHLRRGMVKVMTDMVDAVTMAAPVGAHHR
jgi:transcriptional regulator with XRE-family HTH domain